MNTINLSQYDVMTSSNLSASLISKFPENLSISQTSTNILKLNEVNVVMDTLATQALLKLKEKYKTTTLIIKLPSVTPKK